MVTYEYDLDVTPGGAPVSVNLSQYDQDYELKFLLYSRLGFLDIRQGTVASIRGTKKDGTGYSVDAVINGYEVTVSGDKQMTAVAGKQSFELKLVSKGRELNTANFFVVVERAAMDKDTVKSESVIKEFENAAELTEQLIENAEKTQNNIATLAASADASASAASESAASAALAANTAVSNSVSAVSAAETAVSNSAAATNAAKLSESWARGGTGVRQGEDTNSSKYFSDLAAVLTAEAEKLLDQAQKVIVAATQGALIPGGTVTFQNLPTNPATGYMYNISNDFTTDSRFVEGAGVFYRAGANVYWTADGKWDVLVGTQVTGVKGAKESTYHVGNVNLTPDNIGAVAIEDFNDRFAIRTKAFNALTDFPSSGSGFGVCNATNGLTLYDGFTIPRYSRIIFTNYGSSQDGALIAFASNGNTYTAFRDSGVWKNGKIFATENNTWSLSGGIAIPENADLNDYKTVGNYICRTIAISNTVANMPESVRNNASSNRSFVLKVEDIGSGTIGLRQTFIFSWDGETWSRRYNKTSGEWTEWVLLTPHLYNNLTIATPGVGALDAYQGKVLDDKIKNSKSLTTFINIPDGADMKSSTYLVPGNYCCISNSKAESLVNCPTKRTFTLEVSLANGNNSYIKQRFSIFDGSGIIERTKSNNGDWIDEYNYLPSDVSSYSVPKPTTGIINIGDGDIWTCVLHKSGRVVTINFNVRADMIAVNNFKTVFNIPEKYRPISQVIQNYVVQPGKTMGISILSNGDVMFYNMNIAIENDWICRQCIAYIASN